MSIFVEVYNACKNANINEFYNIMHKSNAINIKYNINAKIYSLSWIAPFGDEYKTNVTKLTQDDIVNQSYFWQNVIIGTMTSRNISFALFIYKFMGINIDTLLNIITNPKIAINERDNIKEFNITLLNQLLSGYELNYSSFDVTYLDKLINYPHISNLLINKHINDLDYCKLITVIGNYQRYDLLGKLGGKLVMVKLSKNYAYTSMRYNIIHAIKYIQNANGFVYMSQHFNVTVDEYITLLEYIIEHTDNKVAFVEIFDYLLSCITMTDIKLRDFPLTHRVFTRVCQYGLIKYVPNLLTHDGFSPNTKMYGLELAIKADHVSVVKLLVPILKDELKYGINHLIGLDDNDIVKNVEIFKVMYDNGLKYDEYISPLHSVLLSDAGYKVHNYTTQRITYKLVQYKKLISVIFKKKLDQDTMSQVLKFIGCFDIYNITERLKTHKNAKHKLRIKAAT